MARPDIALRDIPDDCLAGIRAGRTAVSPSHTDSPFDARTNRVRTVVIDTTASSSLRRCAC